MNPRKQEMIDRMTEKIADCRNERVSYFGAAAADIGEAFAQTLLVLPILPMSVFELFEPDYSYGERYYHQPEDDWHGTYASMILRPQRLVSNDDPPEIMESLLGTVTKTIQQLERAGNRVERIMNPAVALQNRLDITLLTQLNGQKIAIRFRTMPVGDNCRIEIEDVEVPATVKKVQKVVCD